MLIFRQKIHPGTQDWCSKVSWVSKGRFGQGFKINFSVRKMEKAFFFSTFLLLSTFPALLSQEKLGFSGRAWLGVRGNFLSWTFDCLLLFYWGFWQGESQIPPQNPDTLHQQTVKNWIFGDFLWGCQGMNWRILGAILVRLLLPDPFLILAAPGMILHLLLGNFP